MKFIADCHFGRLAKYLRLMGYDTLYFDQIGDDALLQLARKEDRIILTRDRELAERGKTRCRYIGAQQSIAQLREANSHFDLKKHARPFTRCMRCNTLLQPVDKTVIASEIPPKVKTHFEHFDRCPTCGRIYWHGDHYRHMKTFLENFEHPQKN